MMARLALDMTDDVVALASAGSSAAVARETMLLLAGEALPPSLEPQLRALPAVRLVARVDLASLAERLSNQARLDILWLAGDAALSPLLIDRISAELDRLDAGLVCEMDGSALDTAFAAFAHRPGTQFLSAADALDRAVAMRAASPDRSAHVADSAADSAAERIDRLQEEVARISALLADMAGRELDYAPSRPGPVSFVPMVRANARSYRGQPEFDGPLMPPPAPPAGVDSGMVRRILRQRRMREQFFPADLFADPAWDMLLDLYAARLEGHPVAVSSLCIAAAVPATTALRWIKTMTDNGLFERQADPRDGRRIFIGLAPHAEQAMERYFTALEGVR